MAARLHSDRSLARSVDCRRPLLRLRVQVQLRSDTKLTDTELTVDAVRSLIVSSSHRRSRVALCLRQLTPSITHARSPEQAPTECSDRPRRTWCRPSPYR